MDYSSDYVTKGETSHIVRKWRRKKGSKEERTDSLEDQGGQRMVRFFPCNVPRYQSVRCATEIALYEAVNIINVWIRKP